MTVLRVGGVASGAATARWALIVVVASGLGCAGGEPTNATAPQRAPAQTPASKAPLKPDADRATAAVPIRLQTLIADTLAAAPTNPPTQIISYRYRGQSVYYRPPYCCDVQGVVFDADGAVMCHPDGGFTGKGDGRCADFVQARSDCAVVWRDPRTKATTDPCDRPATPTSSER
jgi:hypothetical protein